MIPGNQEIEYNENIDLKNELDIEIRLLNNKYIENRKEKEEQKNGSGEGNMGLEITNLVTRTASGTAEAIIESTNIAASTALRVFSIGFIAVGCIVGAGIGGYFTSKYCEEMIDKFADYYKKNGKIINNLYSNAIKYLEYR